MAREHNLVLNRYDIGEWRYKELKAFCRQYAEKKARAAALLGVSSSSHVEEFVNADGLIEGVVTPSGKGGTSDPVARAAEKREELLADVEIIDRCAEAVAGGAFAKALILNICYGLGYDFVDKEILPTSNRNAYFDARRQFFYLLSRERGGY